MKKVFVLGGINVDCALVMDKFPSPGETVKGKALLLNPGGKGGNQAVAVARMGVPVYAIGKVGSDDLGEIATSIMKASGVQLDFVSQTDSEPTGMALIWINEKGQNAIGFYPGATLTLNRENIARALEIGEQGDILLCTFEVPSPVVFYALEKAKAKGMFTILNPAPAESIPEEIFDFIDVLTPNETEVYQLAGVEATTRDLAKLTETAQGILKNHPKCSMAITLGDNGCVYVTHDSWKSVAPNKTEAVIDTTAAGDAFNGAFAASLALGRDKLASLELANIAGSLAVRKLGAQQSMPYIKEVYEVYEGK
ncbi:MAG: ribokinase [Candidatus Hydrothermota bacterium]|nr:MAG: ribokinase [Candidatus Hydrothermae bacterium]